MPGYVRGIIKRFLGLLFLGLSLLSLFFSWFPLLLPVLLILVVSYTVPGIIIIRREMHKASQQLPQLFNKSFMRRLLLEKHAFSEYYCREGLIRRTHTAIRLGALSLTINIILYILLSAHSWLVYIGSLNRELEPMRKAFSTLSREYGKPAEGIGK